jgi:hypothetical protein
MTNNPTNINNKKREKLQKESINSDGQQFLPISPKTSHLEYKKTTMFAGGNPCHCMRQADTYGEIKSVYWI